MRDQIKLIECPRDAMQGWKTIIPTDLKVAYIQQLLKVGFDTIDFGSFVSEKAIPQMADTKEVVSRITLEGSRTKLLAIVGNTRGASIGSSYDIITYLGFPFSLSATFQQRNIQSTIEQSFETVKMIRDICIKSGKEAVVYISMAFGNPYGDLYDENMVVEWVGRLRDQGIQIISLADTVGLATPAQVSSLVSKVVKAFPELETGVHLHSTRLHWKEKLEAAHREGCHRFDGALMGVGGCPLANNTLVGNMDTVLMADYFGQKGLCGQLNQHAFSGSIRMAEDLFK